MANSNGDDNTIPEILRDVSNIAGFWNIYAEGPYFRDIVNEQMRVMITSGLMDRVDTLYYTTMGNRGHNFTFDTGGYGSKVKHIQYFGNNGSEIQTLGLLYDFCHTHSNSKVFYFHNKGSLNAGTLNDNFRGGLDCFNLNPACADALDTHDTCGWRISPLPHVHYSGNYWWARCRHINSLIPPSAPIHNQTFIEFSMKLYRREKDEFGRAFSKVQPTDTEPFPDQPYLGLGRYFAETWVGSKPLFKPADCMNASENNRWLWGKFPLPWRKLNKYCPNFRSDFLTATAPTATKANFAATRTTSAAGTGTGATVASDSQQGSRALKADDNVGYTIHKGASSRSIGGRIAGKYKRGKRKNRGYLKRKPYSRGATTTGGDSEATAGGTTAAVAATGGTGATTTDSAMVGDNKPKRAALNFPMRVMGHTEKGGYPLLAYALGPCQFAGMMRQPKLMQKRYVLSIHNLSEELIDRSLYWYGEKPVLQSQWLSLFT